jgi:hypothetical protein
MCRSRSHRKRRGRSSPPTWRLARWADGCGWDRRYLPLDRLRVTSAVSLDRGDRRQARSLWSLSVTGGDEDLDMFDIQSTWLTLAYLGTLAGWPEPPRV